LGHCLIALRAGENDCSHSKAIIERRIDDYLRTDPVSRAHGLERLRNAIQHEESEQRDGEDWSAVKVYVRELLRAIAS
jgi:hypothetical protein